MLYFFVSDSLMGFDKVFFFNEETTIELFFMALQSLGLKSCLKC